MESIIKEPTGIRMGVRVVYWDPETQQKKELEFADHYTRKKAIYQATELYGVQLKHIWNVERFEERFQELTQ